MAKSILRALGLDKAYDTPSNRLRVEQAISAHRLLRALERIERKYEEARNANLRKNRQQRHKKNPRQH